MHTQVVTALSTRPSPYISHALHGNQTGTQAIPVGFPSGSRFHPTAELALLAILVLRTGSGDAWTAADQTEQGKHQCMQHIHLTIDVPGRQSLSLRVAETVRVDQCIAWLVGQLALPTTDLAGLPQEYALHRARDGRMAPGEETLHDAGIAHGSRLTLLSVPRTPVACKGRPSAAMVPRLSRVNSSAHPPVNRRTVLRWTIISSCAFLGMGAGVSVAAAQSLLRRPTVESRPNSVHRPTSLRATLPQASLVTFFTAHQQTVRAVSWSPDGSRLASGGDDARALVWTPAGQLVRSIPHSSPVGGLAWSRGSDRLVSAAGNIVTFFTAAAGTILARVSAHTAPVTSVAWTPHSTQQVVSGGEDRRAIVWETITYQPQTAFTGHTTAIEAVSWASDGQTVASSSQGGAIRVWRAASGQEVHPFYLPLSLPQRAAAFSPMSPLLAVGGNDGTIRLWNGLQCLTEGTSTAGLLCLDTPVAFQQSPSAVRSLAWSPNGRFLAEGNDAGSLTLWEPARNQLPVFTQTVQAGTTIHSLAWSPDGDRLATAVGAAVCIWHLAL